MAPHKDYSSHLEYQRAYNAKRASKDKEYRTLRKDHINALRRLRKKRWRMAGKPPTPQRPKRKTYVPPPWYGRENTRRWRAKNPEWAKQNNRKAWLRRRARLAAASIGNEQTILGFVNSVRTKKYVRCYYCQTKTAGKTCHIDHIVPLSKGGRHSIDNLCVSCPGCNLSKHNRLLRDYIKLGQQLLSL